MTQEILGALQGENPAAEETGALPSAPSAQAACPPAPFSFSGPIWTPSAPRPRRFAGRFPTLIWTPRSGTRIFCA